MNPHSPMNVEGSYSLIERLELTIGNLHYQKGVVMFDDFEKLEDILQYLKSFNT